MTKQEAQKELAEIQKRAKNLQEFLDSEEEKEQTQCRLEHLGVYRMSKGDPCLALEYDDTMEEFWIFSMKQKKGIGWFKNGRRQNLDTFPVEQIGKIAVVPRETQWSLRGLSEGGVAQGTFLDFDPLSLTGNKL